MILYYTSIIFVVLAVICWLIHAIDDTLRVKGWAVFFTIAAAAVLVIKYCLDNPETVKSILESLK